MPIYEFRCAKCRRKTSVFIRGFTVKETPACSFCGSMETARVFSTFAVGKSSKPDLSQMYDDLSRVDTSTPESMARVLKEANAERGDDAELDEIVGRMEKGEVPDDLYGALAGEGFYSEDSGEGSNSDSKSESA